VYDLTLEQNNKQITSFATPVTLSFNVVKEVKAEDKLAVYFLNPATNKWEKVGGELKEGHVTVNTSHFSTYAVFNENELPVASNHH
ncbi:hypothetical protein RYX53_15980, partial [Alkalibacillus haloalkaliphilus]|nr:hypothetical protein [Alkalibacillus haloalkaliphilus]